MEVHVIKTIPILLLAVCAALFLGSCKPTDQGVTVSGTVSGTNTLLDSTAKVTITQGSTTQTVILTIPSAPSQSEPYSIKDVPKGIYDISVLLSSGASCFALDYSINGGAPVTAAYPQLNSAYNGTDYDYSLSVTGQSVQSDTTVDVRTYQSPC
jgi:hypothetical protein